MSRGSVTSQRDSPVPTMMSCLRVRALSRVWRRHLSTPTPRLPDYIPYTQLDNIDPRQLYAPGPPKPATATFFTGRAAFYETLYGLEGVAETGRGLLRRRHLFPFPDQAKRCLPPWRVAWRNATDMGMALGNLRITAAHRRVLVNVLKEMHVLRRIALAGKAEDALALLEEVLALYEKPKSDAERRARRDTRDTYGRSYALGRRKESAARVWMIPTLPQGDDDGEETIPATEILVNNLPLASYFKNAVDRTRAVRPLKVAGVFGQYNVFVLARGGGLTGQAGAMAHGIARNLVMHRPDLEPILLKSASLSPSYLFFNLFFNSQNSSARSAHG